MYGQTPYSRYPPPLHPPPLSMPAQYPQQSMQSYNMSTHTAASQATSSSPHDNSSNPAIKEEREPEPDHSNLPTPPPFTTEFDGKIWALEIGQQPVRARMCGFGDKDRRPITPPPCVRLVVLDKTTMKEIASRDLNTSLYVVSVDLWNVEANEEINMVKHAPQNSPAISSVKPSSFPHNISALAPGQPMPNQYDFSQIPMYQQNMGSFTSPTTSSHPSSASSYYPPNGAYRNGGNSAAPYTPQQQHQRAPYQNGGQMNGNGFHSQRSPSQSSQQTAASPYQNSQNNALTGGNYNIGHSMYTRNLIGSLVASAFKLTDTDQKEGVWFILQDLSVRTEGWFRLKMNFINVGSPVDTRSANGNEQPQQMINTKSSPVLASIFSQPFQVFSAKKFPGVIESTAISREFARQGIKIPIRKEGSAANGKRKVDSEENEDEDD